MTSVAVLEAKIRFQNRRIPNSSKQISLPLSQLRYSLIADKNCTTLDHPKNEDTRREIKI
jgi:hypothetical protein